MFKLKSISSKLPEIGKIQQTKFTENINRKKWDNQNKVEDGGEWSG